MVALSAILYSPGFRQRTIDFVFSNSDISASDSDQYTDDLSVRFSKLGRAWSRIHVSKAFMFLSWILWTGIQTMIPLLIMHFQMRQQLQRENLRFPRGRVIPRI